jgi:hypothetical protein
VSGLAERPKIRDFLQVAVVTRDLMATVQSYVALAGIGPWAIFDFEPPELTNCKYLGKPTNFSARLALAWCNGKTFEVIQPLEGRSMYSDFLEEHGEGLNHVLVSHDAPDLDAFVEAMEAEGCPTLMSMEFRGTRFAYVDTRGPLKMITEVVQRPPGSIANPNGPNTQPTAWYPGRQ